MKPISPPCRTRLNLSVVGDQLARVALTVLVLLGAQFEAAVNVVAWSVSAAGA
jgi:hypothetical protein